MAGAKTLTIFSGE